MNLLSVFFLSEEAHVWYRTLTYGLRAPFVCAHPGWEDVVLPKCCVCFDLPSHTGLELFWGRPRVWNSKSPKVFVEVTKKIRAGQ